jgi:hypothetical protein
MPKAKTTKSTPAKSSSSKANTGPDPFRFRSPAETAAKVKPLVHIFTIGPNKTKVVCDTDTKGHATPGGHSVLEIVVDASEGFIPLWARNTTLRWRFNETSMLAFQNPATAKNGIRKMLGAALLAWGDAVPVKFAERTDAWDFEIVMRKNANCDANGCVLASAFFPDAGQHQLKLYPTLFSQSPAEQVETLVHEIGHAFGLRHFFAKVSEGGAASEIFGVHNPFSIMNYGAQSVLTGDDRSDLKRLYHAAWAGQLTHINSTPIKFVKPFHTVGGPPDNAAAGGTINAVTQRLSWPA